MYEPWQYALGAVAAILSGFAKTGLPGSGILIVPLMALIFAPNVKDSVGILLPMLIVGDLFAVIYYKRHTQWHRLWKLFPWVLPGMAVGVLLLSRIDQHRMRTLSILLGVIVLVLVAVEVLRQIYKWHSMPHKRWFIGSTGSLAGFTTTVGNAAGPIMNLYFLGLDLPKEQFVGTSAWFFCIINLLKVPLYLSLGMIRPEGLVFDAAMVIPVTFGALLGVKLLPKIPQRLFNNLVRLLAAVAAIKLIIG